MSLMIRSTEQQHAGGWPGYSTQWVLLSRLHSLRVLVWLDGTDASNRFLRRYRRAPTFGHSLNSWINSDEWPKKWISAAMVADYVLQLSSWNVFCSKVFVYLGMNWVIVSSCEICIFLFLVWWDSRRFIQSHFVVSMLWLHFGQSFTVAWVHNNWTLTPRTEMPDEPEASEERCVSGIREGNHKVIKRVAGRPKSGISTRKVAVNAAQPVNHSVSLINNNVWLSH